MSIERPSTPLLPQCTRRSSSPRTCQGLSVTLFYGDANQTIDWCRSDGGTCFKRLPPVVPYGLMIFVIPACLIGAGAAHWLRRQGNAKREPIFTRNRSNDPSVIEGEYRVLDERRR